MGGGGGANRRKEGRKVVRHKECYAQREVGKTETWGEQNLAINGEIPTVKT
jgi:hypothetical protein